MFETIAVILGLGLIVLVGRALGAGSEAILEELFPRNRQLAWPRGVQEEDAPPFAFEAAS